MFFAAIRRPPVIDRLDPEVFAQIRSCAPAMQATAEWSRHAPRDDYYAPGLLEALLPLNSILLTKFCKREPSAIEYNVDTLPVKPHRPQLTAGWHIDGGKSHLLVVADALPSELLIARGRPLNYLRTYRLLQMFREKDSGFGAGHDKALVRTCDEFIENGISRIYQPDPYEIVAWSGIHRSTINEGPEDCARTWVGATIFHEKPAYHTPEGP